MDHFTNKTEPCSEYQTSSVFEFQLYIMHYFDKNETAKLIIFLHINIEKIIVVIIKVNFFDKNQIMCKQCLTMIRASNNFSC